MWLHAPLGFDTTHSDTRALIGRLQPIRIDFNGTYNLEECYSRIGLLQYNNPVTATYHHSGETSLQLLQG